MTRKGIMIASLLLTVLLVWVGSWSFFATDPDKPANPIPSPAAVRGNEKATPSAATGSPETLTEAERIARLQRSIDADEKAVQVLQDQLASPTSEFQQAETEFKELDARLTEKTKEIQKLKSEGQEEAAAAAEQKREALLQHWQRARERFNVAIQDRKTQQEKAAFLQQKIQHDRKALAQLTAPPPPREPEVATGKPVPGSKPEASPPPAAATATDKPTPPAPALPDPAAPSKGSTPPATPARKALHDARQEAHVHAEDARQAQETARAVAERIEVIRRNVDAEQRLLDSSRKQYDLALQAKAALNQELQLLLADNPSAEEVRGLWLKIAEAERRAVEAEALERSSTNRLQDLHAELTDLQTEQLEALQHSEDKARKAESVQNRVNWLEHPLHPHNIGMWILDHAPKIVAIILGMLTLYFLLKFSIWRVVAFMTRNNQRGTEEERRHRTEGLVGVFRNVASAVIFGGGTLMLLESVGIPIVPLLGGAAVVGLAVAFGAQNLIRDYFAGFMLLLEDQYGVNDVARINDISGLVECITLRMTVLRDLSGVVHFIPHGTITRVSNMTHGWSRALFEIGVAYKEDVDRVMAILVDLGKELRLDPVFGPLILEDPEMLGVDSFGDSGVNIMFFLKTKPLQQWTVRREMLRRIKHRFDELKIEIPFPHRTVYHRYDRDELLSQAPAEAGMEAA